MSPPAAEASERVPMSVIHRTEVGPYFRLVSLDYHLDGDTIFHARAPRLRTGRIEVARPLLEPGEHLLTVRVVYRGHGKGPFAYLAGYRFTVQSSYRFRIAAGHPAALEVLASERAAVRLEQRPTIQFRARGAPSVKAPAPAVSAARSNAERRRRFGIGAGVALADIEPRWSYSMSYFADPTAIADFAATASETALSFAAGIRLRGPRLPIIHPFVGAALAVTHRFDDGQDQITHDLALRAGFDVRFPGDRWIVTAEVAAMVAMFDDRAPWRAGTAALSYLF